MLHPFGPTLESFSVTAKIDGNISQPASDALLQHLMLQPQGILPLVDAPKQRGASRVPNPSASLCMDDPVAALSLERPPVVLPNLPHHNTGRAEPALANPALLAPLPAFPMLSLQANHPLKHARQEQNHSLPSHGNVMDVPKSLRADLPHAETERNLREQRCSNRIDQHIVDLQALLNASNVPCDTDDHHSVLTQVTKYIQELQNESMVCDCEHVQLLETIRSTTRVMQGESLSSIAGYASPSYNWRDNDAMSLSESEFSSDDAALMRSLTHEIDYQAVFGRNLQPLGIVSLAGTVLETNQAFERLMNPGHKKSSMKGRSLFVFIVNHLHVFEAMSTLIQQAVAVLEQEPEIGSSNPFYWCGPLVLRTQTLSATLTLTNIDDLPVYFSIFLF